MIPPSPQFPFFTNRICLFILGCSGSLLLCRLSLVTEGRDSPLVVMGGPLIVVASLAAEGGL